MRTSLNEIKAIEGYLFKTDNSSERLVLEANLLINKSLRENVIVQKQVYQLVKMYGRNQLKSELQEVHNELFQKPEHRGFKQLVLNIFKGKQ